MNGEDEAIHLRLGVVDIHAVQALFTRSLIPWKLVVPPESTTSVNRSLRIYTSHFMLLNMSFSAAGWNNNSAERERLPPTR